MHKFFDDLRSTHFKTATPISMFWFSDEELNLMTEEMRRVLVPDWVNIEQGGDVPRGLGLAKRPEVGRDPTAGRASIQSTSSAVSGCSSAAPSLGARSLEEKEKRPRKREVKKEDDPDKTNEKERTRRSDDKALGEGEERGRPR
jgi:hypothetical protein